MSEITSIKDIDEIAMTYADIYYKVETLEAQLSELKRIKEERKDVLLNLLINNEKDNWRIPGVGQFIVKSKNHLSVTNQDKAIPFIKDNAPELLKVHTTFIKSWFNEFKEQYEEANGLTDTAFWEEHYGIKPYQAPELSFRRQGGE